MGSRIARRLLDAGHDVVVWNRTPARAAGFPRIAATAAEAAAAADVTITMLTNAEALHEVTRGIQPRVLIEMSTVGPDAVRELAERLEVIDAPVLGSRSEAEAGTLHVFVGATDEQYARWSPLLGALGTPHHVGPLGSGASAKLVANSTLFGTIAVLGEALKLAERLGLSREAAYEVLAATPRRRSGAAPPSRRTTIPHASRSPSPARTPTWSAQQRPTCASRRLLAAGWPKPTTPAGATAITPLFSAGF